MTRRTHILSGVLTFVAVSLLLLEGACAEPGIPSPKVFRARRNALVKKLGNQPVLIFGATLPDGISTFRQSNRFYYLTGVTEPDAALLLLPAKRREILFLTPINPRLEKWESPRLGLGKDAKKTTGFHEIKLRKDLPEVLDTEFAGRPSPQLFLPLDPEEIGQRIKEATNRVNVARQKDPLDGGAWREDRIRLKLLSRIEGLEIKDASPVIRQMRTRKGPYEIEALRYAGKISSAGMIAAMKATKPGVYEYEIDAAMAHVCRTAGGQGWAYAPIVGSGPNALIMHYCKNDRKVKAGDLILMDAGFFWNHYAMDITRTFPASGRFTPEQRKAYGDLLGVQIEAIRRVKPGATLSGLSGWVNGKLRALGYRKNLVHSLGHYLGMAVHDPVPSDRKFQAGHVITIEPGIYFYDKGFGIRIEDTVLVTPGGCEVLTKDVPKDVASIERLMKKR
ncbi:MAG: aminopeptidase P N-terminal domain-containing protein [Planctomycetota bacterium]|jgi:Xaa-Pro aminopeptidase